MGADSKFSDTGMVTEDAPDTYKKLALAIWTATSADKEDKNGGNGRKQKQEILVGFLKICWDGELWEGIVMPDDYRRCNWRFRWICGPT